MSFLNTKNRAKSTLAADITATDTSLTVAAGEGTKFPDSNFHITLEKSNDPDYYEICLCTSRTNDVFTIERAKEGTTAVAHLAGSKVELRITAGIIQELQQKKVNFVGTPVLGQVAFWTAFDIISGDNALYWDNINKRLGIGTTMPQNLLHVGSGGGHISLSSTRVSIYTGRPGDTGFGVHDTTNDVAGLFQASAGGIYLGSVTNHNVVIRTNDANRFVIDTDGNVGIGIANPQTKLDVRRSDPNYIIRFGTDTSHYGFLSAGGVGDEVGLLGWEDDVIAVREGNRYYYGSHLDTGDRIITVNAQTGNVGFGTIEPNVSCDVNGGLALRVGTITLGNGQNHNIAIGNRSFIRVTGPTDAFTLTGFADGYDGKMLIVYNTTAQNMTIANENANSLAANRIWTLTGGNVTLIGTSSSTFIYSSTDSRWIFIGERV